MTIFVKKNSTIKSITKVLTRTNNYSSEELITIPAKKNISSILA